MAAITTRAEKGAALTFTEVDANFNNINAQLSSGSGTRNVLINANPIINQRAYVSGTATTTANQYTLDRWRVVTSGQSVTWSDSGNVRTINAPVGGIEQVIEGSSLISGTYALSWTGTAAATVAGVAVTKGGSVTLTGGVNVTVRFSGGSFSLPQLEPGANATQFEQRSYGAELAMCQRYFYAMNENPFYKNWAGGYYNQGTIFVTVTYPVTMRAAPTFSGGWYNGTNAAAGVISVTPRLIQAELIGISPGAYYSANLSLGNFSAEL